MHTTDTQTHTSAHPPATAAHSGPQAVEEEGISSYASSQTGVAPDMHSYTPFASENSKTSTSPLDHREPDLGHHCGTITDNDDDKPSAAGALPMDLEAAKQQQDASKTDSVTSHNEKIRLVGWEGSDDPNHPHNWSVARRIYLTSLACVVVLASTFTSSISSGVSKSLMEHYGFGEEVAALTISIFVAGYILGPWLWGPLSERIGRRKVFSASLLIYTCWNVGCALAPNTGALLAFRLLAGTAAAAPLSNSGGLIADLWKTRVRGIATGLYACAPFTGPALGPIVSGFIQDSGVNFRWAFWVCAIFSGVCWSLVVLTLPETYAPVLLKHKAQHLRRETGSDLYRAPLEQHAKLTPSTLVRTVLIKPFIMSVQEPMLLASILFMAFLYGVVYLLFEAVPIVFGQGYGFSAGIVGLMFIPFAVGAFGGVLFYIAVLFPRYARMIDRAPDSQVAPEERLPMAMLGAPVLTIGFFWFAWTSDPNINFWAPMLSTALLGFGIFFVFQGLFNFIIDAYTVNAASALAAGVIVRSCFGAAFPLFARQMYSRLGTKWGSSLLGFLALAMTPIPFLLHRYGARLRAMSRNAK
ncbi:MFS general substrate transporter [Moesziomyces antarcticus]|uniref:Related to TPO3 - Polyamine transport protein n=1 Tax=Pseudozyma antarctica TaxID=84753 RepID=A0A5C3FHF5_PSEA2|nr:MFS general substrate transporter [Moesziomyces antarcticus]GAK62695.1 MFS general substrate transporter [Moesziomyces antarcticus]SPO43832.1 related to TPO3 - Polyamine transport protein [Moesziomyces antarcticus]